MGENELHDQLLHSNNPRSRVCTSFDPISCVVGWDMDGQPGAAKFLYHDGVNGNDHPVWMVNRAEEAGAPAPGMVIPQPGYYSHYHWITTTNTIPRPGGVGIGTRDRFLSLDPVSFRR